MAKKKEEFVDDGIRPIRIARYARVSRKEQILENQLLVLDREIERHPNWTVIETYTDKASGADQHRPGLDAMMADAEKHRFDLIICTKLDRMARSMLNLSKICKDLEKWGVGLKFVEQDIDTTTPEGKLLRNFLGAVAEYELELIHSRTIDGQARAVAEGKVIGRPKTKLSDYQIAKAKEIIENNPNISQRKLAEEFIGIDRKQLVRELKALGILPNKDPTATQSE